MLWETRQCLRLRISNALQTVVPARAGPIPSYPLKLQRAGVKACFHSLAGIYCREPPRTAAIVQVSVVSSCTASSSDIARANTIMLVERQVPRLPSLHDSVPLADRRAPLVVKSPL